MPPYGLTEKEWNAQLSGTGLLFNTATANAGSFLNASARWIQPSDNVNWGFGSQNVPYITDKERISWGSMKMPQYAIVDESGTLEGSFDKEDEAKRKAKQLASANKRDYYVLKPIFRFEPKDVPVEEVAL